MPYPYLKENEETILRAGKKERWGKFLYNWEKKEKQKQEDLKKWKKKVINMATTKQDLTGF